MSEASATPTFEDILCGLDRSPSKWTDRSRELWRAAEILQEAASRAHEQLFPIAMARQDEFAKLIAEGVSEETARSRTAVTVAQEQDLQLTSAVTMQGAMLRAFSIECLLKSMYYEREINAKGHVRNCDEVDHTHDLVFLCEKLNIPIDQDQKTRLESLRELMTLGRYPTLKKVEKDKATKQQVIKRWHANAESNPLGDADLRAHIERHIQ
jgi:hypothetical protein